MRRGPSSRSGGWPKEETLKKGWGTVPDWVFCHTFARLLRQNGESPVYVKEQMGHSSIQVTVDIYGHLIPGANRQAVDRLDDATGRNPGATRSQAAVAL